MDYLRNINTGAITDGLDAQGELYQRLAHQLQPGTTTNKPLWEACAEENSVSAPARVAVAVVPPLAAAATDTVAVDASVVSEGGTITSVEYIADAPGIVGAATNSRTLTVTDGATTKATLALVVGTNAQAGVPASFIVNSAAIVGGDQLVVASTAVGTGLPDTGGIVTIEFTLTA